MDHKSSLPTSTNPLSVVSAIPNPFSDRLTFSWSVLEKQSLVDLKIYNSEKRQVSHPIQNKMYDKGSHNHNLDSIEKELNEKTIYHYLFTIDGKQYSGKILRE